MQEQFNLVPGNIDYQYVYHMNYYNLVIWKGLDQSSLTIWILSKYKTQE